MSEPADVLTASERSTRVAAASDLADSLGIDGASAETLVGAGYRSVEQIRALSDETLQALGIQPPEITRLRHGVPPGEGEQPSRSVDGSQAVARWLDSIRKAERPRRKVTLTTPKDSTEILKKWVEGDDRVMEDWIQSPEPVASPAFPTPVPPRTPALTKASSRSGSVPRPTHEPAAPVSVEVPGQIVEREETVVRWLTNLLDRVKTDQFDPATVLQEGQELHRQLFEERARLKQLEEELEHVKRGSIAVIKYVRSREAKAREQLLHEKEGEIAELRLRLMTLSGGEMAVAPPPIEADAEAEPGSLTEGVAQPPSDPQRRLEEEIADRERAFLEREAELRRRVVQMEGEVRTLRAEAQAREQREELARQEPTKISIHLKERLDQAEARERELALRETELRAKFEEIRIRAEEVERLHANLESKEKEIRTQDEQLSQRKAELEAESERLEASRKELSEASPSVDLSPQVQTLKTEVIRLQRELSAKEQILQAKLAEIEAIQSRVSELEEADEPIDTAAVLTSSQVRTGVRRLDDLFYGGLPTGCQILVNGPAHTGKEVLARLFIAEGLKQGIPGLWVVTDKTYGQIREEMTALLPSYSSFEQQGIVRYVDLYSRSQGVTQAEAGVRLLSSTDKGVLDQIISTVNSYTNEFKERTPNYRLVFESVSTVAAYLDTTQMFRFLQPFAGRRKLDGAVGYYLLETGMHTESDLQTLEHMTDGSINLKIDQLKTFLSVRGIGEVQSRAWIGYTFSKKAFSLGSFSLDKIR